MKLRLPFLTVLIVFALTACSTVLPSATSAPSLTATRALEPTATPTDLPPAATTGPVDAASMVTLALLPAETTVSYSVDETFLSEGNKLATAVGVTNRVTGSLSFDPNQPAQVEFGEFTVDISTLKSDRDRRDRAIQTRWLESATFPIAKFNVTGMSGFPESPQEGQPFSFQMTGDLTVREATQPVTWDVTATYQDGKLTGKATTSIMMADWGVEPPNIAGVLIVKDGVTLTIDFAFLQQ
jgi:polyisoprenoid-binding protein YceI